ncbi:MAG: hypothetical protein ACK5LC_08105, partial [Coprobacillaceae bacterium]
MLFRKMIRDMKKHKMQFLSIFLMAFLGVFVFTGIAGEYVGLQQTSDDFYEETNFADIWLYGATFNEEDVNSLLDMKEIENVDRRGVVNA